MASHKIRVLCDSKNTSFSIADSITEEPLFWWRGNDLTIDLALSDNGVFLTSSDIGSITVAIKALNAAADDAVAMIEVLGSGDCDAGFTSSQWQAQTGALCSASWTRAEAALDAGSYVIVVSHDDGAGKRNTYLHSQIVVKEDQHDSVSLTSPPAPATEYYTKTEDDARFAPITHTHTPSDVGLGSANNTSDADKPVSTAQGVAIAAVQTEVDDAEVVSAALDVRITANAAALISARLAYQTLALLNADLAHGENDLAEVSNDGANNGTYIKVGASGAGSWLKSTNDVSGRVTTAEADITALDIRMDEEEVVTGNIESRMVTEEAATVAHGIRLTALEVQQAGFTFTFSDPTRRLVSTEIGKVISVSGLIALDPLSFPVNSTLRIICSGPVEMVSRLGGLIYGQQFQGDRIGFSAGSIVDIHYIGGANWLATPGGEIGVFTPQTEYGFTSLNLSDANVVTSGSDVTSWGSAEAGGYNFENAAYPTNVPTINAASLNGVDTLNFGSTNEFLDYTVALAGDHTFVFLLKTDTLAKSSAILDGLTVGAGERCLIRQEVGDTYRILTTAALDGGTVDTSWHLLVARFNGGTSFLEVDNVGVSSGTTGVALNASGIRIGVDASLATDFEGEMALFGHITGAWDGTQKTNFIAWVNQKYNLSI